MGKVRPLVASRMRLLLFLVVFCLQRCIMSSSIYIKQVNCLTIARGEEFLQIGQYGLASDTMG